MKKIMKLTALLLSACLCLMLFGCGSKDESEDDNIYIDYGDEEAFELMINAGEDMVGKIVRFTAKELHPDSAVGYNIYAGKHLNLVSTGDPGIAQGETVVVRILTVDTFIGSWLLTYERADEAIDGKKTLTSAEPGLGLPEEYRHNDYFDITGSARLTSTAGGVTIIHEVEAKKDCALTGTLRADDYKLKYEVESAEYTAYLTEGETNCFIYEFTEDISDTLFTASVREDTDHLLMGEPKAVKMVSWEPAEGGAELLLKQKGNFSTFSQFKVLFKSEGRIVAMDNSYISDCCPTLTGKGCEGTLFANANGRSFDEVEFIYER